MSEATPAGSMNVQRYNSGTVVLHWVGALLILTLFVTGLSMEHLGPFDDAATSAIVQFHVLLGAAALVVSVARLLWHFRSETPPPAAFRTVKEARIGHVVHALMYVLMIVVPISGWALVTAWGYDLRGGGAALGVPLPELPLPEGLNGDWAANGYSMLHDFGSWFFLLLVAIHMSAAIAHQLKAPADRLMARIWFRPATDR